MLEKVPTVISNYKRYASEIDIASRKRFGQDQKDAEERAVAKREKEVLEEKRNYELFTRSHFEAKRRNSPLYGTNGASISSDDYDDLKLRQQLIDTRLSEAQMRA